MARTVFIGALCFFYCVNIMSGGKHPSILTRGRLLVNICLEQSVNKGTDKCIDKTQRNIPEMISFNNNVNLGLDDIVNSANNERENLKSPDVTVGTDKCIDKTQRSIPEMISFNNKVNLGLDDVVSNANNEREYLKSPDVTVGTDKCIDVTQRNIPEVIFFNNKVSFGLDDIVSNANSESENVKLPDVTVGLENDFSDDIFGDYVLDSLIMENSNDDLEMALGYDVGEINHEEDVDDGDVEEDVVDLLLSSDEVTVTKVLERTNTSDTTNKKTTDLSILQPSNCATQSNSTVRLPIFRNGSSRKTKRELRRNCCPYCSNFVTNFGRHLVAVHRNEKDVIAYINVKGDNALDKKRKRAAISNELRKKGNHYYSVDNRGILIPTKRASVNASHYVSADTHVSCKFCFGLYKKKYFYLHLPDCEKYTAMKARTSGSSVGKNKLKDTVLCSYSDLVIPNLPQASELLKKDVLPIMARDDISVVAQSDPLILLYGSRFYNSHRNSTKYTSSKMRMLARLLMETNKINPNVKKMCDCIKPQYFNDLMNAIRKLSKFTIESGECSTPGVVAPLCGALKKCCDAIRSETIKSPKLKEKKKSQIYVMLNGFCHLMEKEWPHEVSAIAEQSRKKRKVNKEDVIPDSEDIRDFWMYLEQQCDSASLSLKLNHTPKNYDRLCKIIVAQIITLNRRRPGEVCLATLENYAQVDLNNNVGALEETTLTEEEKNNSKDLSIFYISASKNRKKVPVILTKQMKSALNILINSREILDIKSHLLFPRPGNAGSYEGYDILGELKKKTVLRKPQHFTATGLRHHAATSSQLHCRDDTYTKRLAKFMGHDLQTHENYYEMPLPLVQKGKVGTRLLDMTLHKVCSKDNSEENRICRKNLKNTTDSDDDSNQTCMVKADVLNRIRNKRTDKTETVKHLPTESKSKEQSETISDDTFHEETVSDPDYEPIYSSSESAFQTTPKKKFRKVRWTQAEKNAIYRHLGKYFIMKETPERRVIKSVYEKDPALKNRTLQQVCTYVSNIVTNKLSIPTPEKEKMRRNFLAHDSKLC